MAAAAKVVCHRAARDDVRHSSRVVVAREVSRDQIAVAVLQLILETRCVARVLPGDETVAGGVLGRFGAVAFVEAVEECEDGLLKCRLTRLVGAVEDMQAGGDVFREVAEAAEGLDFDAAELHRRLISCPAKARRP